MKIINTVDEIRAIVKEWRDSGLSVGFVPTMGYLHEGHQSLIAKSVSQNDRTVVSIFLNPIQFAPTEDLESYPHDPERDAKLCEVTGADIIFRPEVNEMYHDGFCTYADMDILTENLCGKSRPTHFRGVCTVVLKLFNIVKPDKAYFGQKDAQQLAIIKRMVRDFNIDIQIVGCPIVREPDGLAKSSRNTYLDKEERKAALILSSSLKKGMELIKTGETDSRNIIAEITKVINSEPLANIDYVSVVDAITMQNVEKIESDVLVAIAVRIGKTRLIDNFSFSV